jgi:hypothetical protein
MVAVRAQGVSVCVKERLVLCPVAVVNHGRLCGNRKISVNNFGDMCYQ